MHLAKVETTLIWGYDPVLRTHMTYVPVPIKIFVGNPLLRVEPRLNWKVGQPNGEPKRSLAEIGSAAKILMKQTTKVAAWQGWPRILFGYI